MINRFPKVVAVEMLDQHARKIQLDIDTDLYWFNGHFPAAPILPGVVQLNWVRQFAVIQWPEQKHWLSQINQLEVVKFQQVIRPGDEVCLSLQLDVAKQRVSFDYSARQDSQRKFASGRLVFQS